MLNAKMVAEYFLWRACEEESELISNLKLQKLMYYAQGYSLAQSGQPLFDAPIHAWDHGPVVEEIYQTYKRFGRNALPCPDSLPMHRYPEPDRQIMDDVFANFGQFSAWKLRDMTHKEPVWQNTKLREVMSPAEMRAYFLTRVDYRPIVVQVDSRSWDEIAEEVLEKKHSLWAKLAKV